MGVEGRRRLESFSTNTARERSLGGVDGGMDFEAAAVHERTTTDLTDMARGVGRVSTAVSSQQGSRPVAPLTHLPVHNTNTRPWSSVTQTS